jgi:hypothetical protein
MNSNPAVTAMGYYSFLLTIYLFLWFFKKAILYLNFIGVFHNFTAINELFLV